MNTPITFPIAKLLKEKGFNLPVKNLYSNEELLENYSLINQYENIYIDDKGECLIIPFSDRNVYLEKVDFNSWSKVDYSAPTIADVVMWIYEKYGIWIWTHITKTEGEGLSWMYEMQDIGGKFIDDQYGHNSPKEAYEAAIEYILTNLITT